MTLAFGRLKEIGRFQIDKQVNVMSTAKPIPTKSLIQCISLCHTDYNCMSGSFDSQNKECLLDLHLSFDINSVNVVKIFIKDDGRFILL